VSQIHCFLMAGGASCISGAATHLPSNIHSIPYLSQDPSILLYLLHGGP